MTKEISTELAPSNEAAQKALLAVKDKCPEEAKILSNYVNHNVIALGTDEAFALRDNSGDIRAFKQRVRLSTADKTLIQPTPGGQFVVSAQGYEVLSEASGTNVIFPREVLVGNEWKQNPHAERDPNNRRILAVYARAVAFRFSSKGIPMVSDWTTIFDTPSYRLIDLLAKAKKLPQAFKLLPSEISPDVDGTWAKYPFDESTNLWVNTSHEEALTWFSQIINREKKSMDFAQTFAKRNAVKHLLGIQGAPGNVWDLPILCWRPTSGNIIKWDATQYAQLQDKVGALIQGSGSDFVTNGTVPQIEAHAGVERVSDEEGLENIEREIDPEDQAVEIEQTNDDTPEVMPGETAMSAEDSKTMKNLSEACSQFPEEAARAHKELGISLNSAVTIEEAKAIYKKINQYIDEESANDK
jgi:hypothetical protein